MQRSPEIKDTRVFTRSRTVILTKKSCTFNGKHDHSVLTICTQIGTCDTRSGDLVFFSAAFDEFSLFTKNKFYYDFVY